MKSQLERFRKFEASKYNQTPRTFFLIKIKNLTNTDIDVIVTDDKKTYDLLMDFRNSRVAFKHKTGYQSAIRAYYRFVNGKSFPKIRDYEPEDVLEVYDE